MASSASTVLRLEIMNPGEQDGTWGQKNNTNLQILEAAITGAHPISTTGGTTDLTALNVDYTNDAAKKAILDISGTLVSNATIQIPNASKTYKVFNRTSGAFTVTIKTASGSGIVITQSTVCEIYCNGSNVVRFATPMSDYTTGAPATSSGAAASSVSVSATGNLSSTNAQAALAELQGDIDAINAALPGYQPLDSDLTDIAGFAKTKGNLIVGNGSAWAAQSVGTDGYALVAKAAATNGLQWSALLPAGTVAMFYQAAAPTGWTASNADSDKALRVVSGTSGLGGTAGGVTPFSTTFDNRVITQSMLPNVTLTFSGTTSSNGAHTHTIAYILSTGGGENGGNAGSVSQSAGSTTTSSNGAHTHTVSGNTSSINGGVGQDSIGFAVQYINIIKASKDAY